MASFVHMMTEPDRQKLPRRDRWAILTGLAGITLLSWIYLFILASNMDGMPMSAVSEIMAIRPWTGVDFLLMFLMWTVMMVPTAVHMTLLYASVARKAAAQLSPSGPDLCFRSRVRRHVVPVQCRRVPRPMGPGSSRNAFTDDGISQPVLGRRPSYRRWWVSTHADQEQLPHALPGARSFLFPALAQRLDRSSPYG